MDNYWKLPKMVKAFQFNKDSEWKTAPIWFKVLYMNGEIYDKPDDENNFYVFGGIGVKYGTWVILDPETNKYSISSDDEFKRTHDSSTGRNAPWCKLLSKG